jgi:tricorn protease
MKPSSPLRTRVAAAAILVAAIGVALRGLDRNPEVRFAGSPHIASDGRIAFAYFGDIWIADADGANARRLTAHIANDFAPRFSPDGQWVAFTSTRTGNTDVFIVPSRGGEPRQLTHFSGADEALYWLPDGKSLLIASTRTSFFAGQSLYRLPIDGGAEEALGPGMSRLGMMKQDGSLLAFNRVGLGGSAGVWRKGYRGNAAPGIAVFDRKADRSTELTNGDPKDYRTHANDIYPMWGADGQIYFASERQGP